MIGAEFVNFLELRSLEKVNQVDMTKYSFVKYSETRDCYIFKLRENVR